MAKLTTQGHFVKGYKHDLKEGKEQAIVEFQKQIDCT